MDRNRTITVIGGSGRCGSTLLRRMLGEHPDVFAAPELRFTVDPGGLVDFYVSASELWSPWIYADRYKRLETLLRATGPKAAWTTYYRRLMSTFPLLRRAPMNLDVAYGAVDASRTYPNYVAFVDQLLMRLKEFGYRAHWTGSHFFESAELPFGDFREQRELASVLGAFYLQLVEDALSKSHRGFYVEKNTWYVLCFDRFLDLVPTAKLVHIHRDPRDVVASLVRQRWAPRNMEQAAVFYKCIMQKWHRVRDEIPPDSFLDVGYERLVADPRAVLGDIEEFANVPVSFEHPNLSKKSIGQWRRELTKAQVQFLETQLASEIELYGSA